MTIHMELRHWNQDKWEAISSKNHVREGCLRFSDKQLIYSTWHVLSDKHAFLPLPRLNHLAWYSERAGDIGFFVIFIVYAWCVFLLLGAIGSPFFVALRDHLFLVYSYVTFLQGSRRKGLYEYCGQLIAGLLYS